MSSRNARYGVIAALAATAILAAGCGSDNSSSGAADSTSASPTTSVAGATTAAASSIPGGDAAPGVTADSITVGLIFGVSGPYAEPVRDYVDGVYIWADGVNAQGGINGRQVKFKEFDHGETADGGVAACKTASEDKGVFMTFEIEGTTAHVTAANCMDQAGVPNIVWQGTEELLPTWKSSFAIFATPEQHGKVLGSYAKSIAKPEDKVAFAIVSTDFYRLAGDSAKAEAERLGVDVVGAEYIEVTGTTFVPQLQKMQDAGATIVVMSTFQQDTTLLKEAETLGFSPQWTGYGFCYDYIPQASPGLYQDVTCLSLQAAIDAPEFQEYSDFAKKYADKPSPAPQSQFFSYGMAEVLGAALDSAGPNPTRDSLLAGMKTISGLETGVIGPVTWTETNHIGTDQLIPLKCCSAQNTWETGGSFSAKF